MRVPGVLPVVLVLLLTAAGATGTDAPAPGLAAELHMPMTMNVTAHSVDWVVTFDGTVVIDKPPGVTVDVTITTSNDKCWMVQCYPTEMTFPQPGNQTFTITVNILAQTTDARCTVTVEMHAQGAGLPVVTTSSCLISVRGPVQKESPAQSMPTAGILDPSLRNDPVFIALATAIFIFIVVVCFSAIGMWRKRAKRAIQPPAPRSGPMKDGRGPS